MTAVKAIVLLLALANVGTYLWMHDIVGSPAGTSSSGGAATGGPAADIPGADTVVTPGKPPVVKLPTQAPAESPSGTAGASGSGEGPTFDEGVVVLDSPPPAVGAATAAIDRCVSIGPFKDVAAASRAASSLRVSGYDPRQRVGEGEIWSGEWVYVPIGSGQGSGEETAAKLKGAGIDDALQMPGPDNSPVISLGVFSDVKRGQSRVAQVKSLGLNPVVTDRTRTGDQYWIDVGLKSNIGAPNPANLQTEAMGATHLVTKPCPGSPA